MIEFHVNRKLMRTLRRGSLQTRMTSLNGFQTTWRRQLLKFLQRMLNRVVRSLLTLQRSRESSSGWLHSSDQCIRERPFCTGTRVKEWMKWSSRRQKKMYVIWLLKWQTHLSILKKQGAKYENCLNYFYESTLHQEFWLIKPWRQLSVERSKTHAPQSICSSKALIAADIDNVRLTGAWASDATNAVSHAEASSNVIAYLIRIFRPQHGEILLRN